MIRIGDVVALSLEGDVIAVTNGGVFVVKWPNGEKGFYTSSQLIITRPIEEVEQDDTREPIPS